MKIILLNHIKIRNLIQILTNCVLWILLLFISIEVNAQSKSQDDERKILYISSLIDEVSLNSYSLSRLFDKYIFKADTCFSNFKYELSEKLRLHFSNNELIKHDIYSVQLFKIASSHYPYYILCFNSSNSINYTFADDLWIRVSGYVENDLKIFFDRLKEKGMSNDMIKSMISLWCEKDSLFAELDWDCLFEGYELNDTKRECYISQKYYRHYASCVNCKNHVVNRNIYSSFSRIILLGLVDFDF